jgi:uncharacterized protein YcbX
MNWKFPPGRGSTLICEFLVTDMWTLGRIWIYPIKSLPGVEISESELLPAGNLRHDREFALVDDAGRFMNAKRTADIHRIQATWDLGRWLVSLRAGDTAELSTFHLDADRHALAMWFSDFFQTRISIEQQPAGGFPDDAEASGPTVISTETLQSVADWFPGLDIAEVRRRFRANLELKGGEPFSEDSLFGAAGTLIPIQFGEAQIYGSNPCQRCVVPTRDTTTGEIWPGFQREFATRREATLPAWANASRFNHFYRLSVNTVVKSSHIQTVRVGDVVRLVDAV